MFGPRSAYHSRLQRRVLTLSLALVGALGSLSAAGASYRIVDLGVDVSPTDISNQGTIVGSRRTDAGPIGFRLLTGGSLEDIVGTQSAQAVNESNDVAGTTLTGAFLLRYDGTYVEWDGYSAYGLNESGQISGNRELPNPYRSRPLPLDPAIYTPSTWGNPGIARVYPRGTRQGVYADGYALLDINDGGLAVGRRWRSGLVGSSAVVTTAAFDDVVSLPVPNGGSANAVNGRNVIVGATGNGGGAVYAHAFRYDHDTAEFLDLGTLHGGLSSSAGDVNESGQIVGTSWLETEPTSVSDPTRYHAFIWDSGVMRDLNDLVDAGSDWTLTSASAVNDNGDIVGVGIRGRQQHGFLLTSGDAAPQTTPPERCH
jgi:probable HAF family extracellular repeat protein